MLILTLCNGPTFGVMKSHSFGPDSHCPRAHHGLRYCDLAHQYKTSVSTIYASVKQQNRSKTTGRHRKTTSNLNRVIFRISKDRPRLSSTAINRELCEFPGVKASISMFCGAGCSFLSADLLRDRKASSVCCWTVRSHTSEEAGNLGEEQEGATGMGEGTPQLDSSAVVQGAVE